MTVEIFGSVSEGVGMSGLVSFVSYLATAAILTLIYVVIYISVTPHAEIKLIKQNNTAAALAFSGSLIGFALPLAIVIAHSVAIVDCAIWGVIAIVVQVIVYFLVRIPVPGISSRIESGEIASGLWLASASLTGGIINAACMTY